MKLITPLSDQTGVEKQPITLECVLSKPKQKVNWLKDGKKIDSKNKNYEVTSDGNKYRLTIKESDMKDKGKYTMKCEKLATSANVKVEGMPLRTKFMIFI